MTMQPLSVTSGGKLPELGEALEGLCDTWGVWPYGHQHGLARRLDEDRYVAIVPMLFTFAVIVGRIDQCLSWYDDRWCYHTLDQAVIAATIWDGTGEPEGWHRHPTSGRRQ